MTLCVRLAVLTALLVAVAIGLIYLRTDTNHAGNRLHSLFSEKRTLEKACCRLELEIARLKNQERLQEQAEQLHQTDVAEDRGTDGTGPRGRADARRPVLVERRTPAPP